jgi:hypothetical protein
MFIGPAMDCPTARESLLNRDDPDVVLVAPKRHRSFGKLLQGIEHLREAGIAYTD